MPNQSNTIEIRKKDFDALMHVNGYQQWLSPNADFEHADEARRVCQGVYGAVLTDCLHRRSASVEDARDARADIFDRHFYVPFLWHCVKYETPDDMFDAVERDMVDSGLLSEDQFDTREDVYAELPSEAE